MATIERLKRRPDFLAAAEGRRFHTERMTAQGRLRDAAPADGQDVAGLRLGLTITKRVGHATERNRIRRRLRAAVEVVAAGLPSELAHLAADIVLIARRPALDAAFETLAEDLRRAIPAVTRLRAPGAPRGDRSLGKSGLGKSGLGKSGGGRSGSTPVVRGAGARPAPPAPPGEADIAPSQAHARDHGFTGRPRSDGPGSGPVATPNTCGGVPDGQ